MPGCMAKFCSNCTTPGNKESKVSYFAFPKEEQKIKLWLHNAGMDTGMVDEYIPIIKADIRSDIYRMCSSHFESECFIMRGSQRRLRPESVPTMFTETGTTEKSGNKWLNRLKKIWMTQHMKAGTSQTAMESATCTCQCHVSSQCKQVSNNDASTQTGRGHSEFVESEVTSDTIFLEHSYCSKEDLLMTPLLVSTPKSHQKTKEVQSVISFSPALPVLSTPSLIPGNSQSAFNPYVESPEVGTKRKLAYLEDPSFHESDCDTPQKGDHSLCESEVEIETEDALPHPLNLVKEKKFIVFESCLDKLLYAMICPEPGCFSKIRKIEKKIIGTMISVHSICTDFHRSKLWESQPKIKHYSAGNILLSGAITLTGGSYAKVREMFDLCGIQIFGKTSFHRSQNAFVFKAIDHSWQSMIYNVNEELLGKPVFLLGDGQCDSPGFSAKYSTYTFMDFSSKKIVDFELVQVSQTTSSVAMEKFGFIKCLDRIIDNGLDVQFVGTDRHTGIRKLLSTNEKYKNINHQFDMWHYVKNIRRKLMQISKKKINHAILPWIGPILLHFYFCSRRCEGDETLFRELWQSLLYHVVNVHEWEIDGVQHKCLHDPLSVDSHPVPWISKNTPAFHSLSTIVLDSQLDKDIKHLTFFCQTGVIETYHSMILKYRPKRIHYRFDSMEARTKLAALCHNHNVVRNPALTKKKDESGQELFVERKNLEFPRGRKKWVVRNVFENMNNDHLYIMLSDMISIVEGTLISSWESKNKLMPRNIAPIERPETSVAVKEHMSRFPKVAK